MDGKVWCEEDYEQQESFEREERVEGSLSLWRVKNACGAVTGKADGRKNCDQKGMESLDGYEKGSVKDEGLSMKW